MNLFLKKCLHYSLGAWMFSLFINTLQLTFSFYMLGVYDRVLATYSFPTLYGLTLIALTALAVFGILHFLRSRLLVQLGIKMDRLMSRPVLKTMLRQLSIPGKQEYNRGLQDVNTLRNFLSGNAVFAFFDVPWVFIYLWIIFLVHPLLGMTAAGGGVILLIVGTTQTLVTRGDNRKVGEVKRQEHAVLQKCLRTAHVLRTMGMVENSARHIAALGSSCDWNRNRAENINHGLGAVSTAFRSMMQVFIYGVGALLVMLHKADTGVIIAASIIMGRALAPIDQGIAAWKETSGALEAYRRLKQLMAEADKRQTPAIDSLRGDLEVTGVTFGIDGMPRPILEDVNFSLKKGEILGLVGHNGAGKTSLCRMLLGMWRPGSGHVRLDGLDVSELNPDTLGPFIGYLPQNVELFPGTVGSNIARLQAVDSEKVIAAAKIAGAHGVILRFPKGYETDIGEAGASLSGGQRQRVGLARALYGEPALVILDEPNSNLDEAGEAALAQALRNLKETETTTIMITHKPGLLYHVDKIMVLNQGKVQAFGPRDEIFNAYVNPGSGNGPGQRHEAGGKSGPEIGVN